MLAAAPDRLEAAELVFGKVGVTHHQSREAQDGVERCAQLMAHIGQKCTFRQVCRYRFIFGVAQRLLGILVIGDITGDEHDHVRGHGGDASMKPALGATDLQGVFELDEFLRPQTFVDLAQEKFGLLRRECFMQSGALEFVR